MKVGRDLRDDIRRLEIVRNTIGWDKTLVGLLLKYTLVIYIIGGILGGGC